MSDTLPEVPSWLAMCKVLSRATDCSADNARLSLKAVEVPINIPDLPQWVVALATGALSAAGAFILAITNRGPAMQAAWLAANKDLVEGYRARVEELVAQEAHLRARLDELDQRCAVCEWRIKAP